jgi:hypothetical protein
MSECLPLAALASSDHSGTNVNQNPQTTMTTKRTALVLCLRALESRLPGSTLRHCQGHQYQAFTKQRFTNIRGGNP